MTYNIEKPRLVECPKCHYSKASVEMGPLCPNDGTEMITLVVDSDKKIIPLRER